MLRLAPFALLLPTVASASVVWRGDFETGNLSQWDREQSVASDRLQVVSSPVREGRYAMKVTVHQGDDPINASGNRNEVLNLKREPAGSEFYYKWSTLFPSSFPRSPKWALFTQWHHDGDGGSPPLEFYVVDDKLTLRLGGSSGKIVWTAPLQREHWNDFVLHVKWSADPKAGFVELYHDGQVVVPKTMVATQYPGQGNYLKLGLYRDESISQEGIVFHDGFVQATNLEDVMPGGAVATPAPGPAPSPSTGTPEGSAPQGDSSTGPVAQLPSDPGNSSLPGPGGVVAGNDPTMGTGMVPPTAGCGASATGGTPLLVAAALTLAALLGRRKALAPARARRPRPSRR